MPEQSPRSRAILLSVVGVVALASVIATAVIFSQGGETPQIKRPDPQVRVIDGILVVGPDSAKNRVVVYEDFGSLDSRTFELAMRSYGYRDAAQGRVRIEYHPFSAGPAGGYSRLAQTAWAASVGGSTPKAALRFHDLLFDQQPASGAAIPSRTTIAAWAASVGITLDANAQPPAGALRSATQAATDAGVQNTPWVLLNGAQVTGASVSAVSDRLESALAD